MTLKKTPCLGDAEPAFARPPGTSGKRASSREPPQSTSQPHKTLCVPQTTSGFKEGDFERIAESLPRELPVIGLHIPVSGQWWAVGDSATPAALVLSGMRPCR